MRIIPLILKLLFASLAMAQNPVTWTTQAKQIDPYPMMWSLPLQ